MLIYEKQIEFRGKTNIYMLYDILQAVGGRRQVIDSHLLCYSHF